MPPNPKFLPIRLSITLLAAAALLLAACAPAATPPPAATAIPVTGNNSPEPTLPPVSSVPEGLTPQVKVSDQPTTGGKVTVESVTSPGPGWIVIHINKNGAPGDIIGWSQVNAGVNNNIQVTIDASKATSVLYAMLHTDAGTVGTYEFPGPDAPVTFQGQMVSPAFAVTGGAGTSAAAEPTATTAAAAPTATTAPLPEATAAATATTEQSGGGYGSPAATETTAPAASGPATVNVSNNARLGNILVDGKEMTLYIFKKDSPGSSACTGPCLENWPALLITEGDPTGGEGVTGKLGKITRPEGGQQVTYNDQPLYYFAGDKAPGDVNGQGIGDAWFAAVP